MTSARKPNAYSRTRRERALARGLCGTCCKRERIPNRSKCVRCMEHHYDMKCVNYRPIDEWLARSRNRVLRALRWFDWVSVQDLGDALDLPDSGKRHSTTERNTLCATLRRLVRGGLVDARTERHVTRYRLSPTAPREVLIPPFDPHVIAPRGEVAA